MASLERLEPRSLACAWAPEISHASHAPESAATAAALVASVADDPAALQPAGAADYNTAFLTDAQLEDYNSMSAAEIRAFLASRGSYFRQAIPDVDGVTFDP